MRSVPTELIIPLAQERFGLGLACDASDSATEGYCQGYWISTSRRARFWCNLDACGLLCVLTTWGMVVFSVYVVIFVLLRPVPVEECFSVTKLMISLLYTAVAGLAVTAHVRTMLTDPGAVPRHATPVPLTAGVAKSADMALDCDGGGGGTGYGEEETSSLTVRTPETDGVDHLGDIGRGREERNGEDALVVADEPQRQRHQQEKQHEQQQKPHQQDEKEHVVKWCHKCDAFKPPRAHHCSLCQRCIVKMDHHCPWVNNCIGIRNQKLFILFCAYTCILCAFALVIEGVVVLLIGDKRLPQACRSSPSGAVATIALAVMAILFGIFTLCMACDQCQMASTNQTKIDRLKGEVHERGGGANEVFGVADGVGCRFHWLLPVPARFPAGDAASTILGYCIGRGCSDADDEGKRVISSDVARGIAGKRDGMELAEYGGVTPVGVSSGGRGGGKGKAKAVSGARIKRSRSGDYEEMLGTVLVKGSSDNGSKQDFR